MEFTLSLRVEDQDRAKFDKIFAKLREVVPSLTATISPAGSRERVGVPKDQAEAVAARLAESTSGLPEVNRIGIVPQDRGFAVQVSCAEITPTLLESLFKEPSETPIILTGGSN